MKEKLTSIEITKKWHLPFSVRGGMIVVVKKRGCNPRDKYPYLAAP